VCDLSSVPAPSSWEQAAVLDSKGVRGHPPTRVFLRKSVEVADSNEDDFFGSDKEFATV
jgi:hypothetical protein